MLSEWRSAWVLRPMILLVVFTAFFAVASRAAAQWSNAVPVVNEDSLNILPGGAYLHAYNIGNGSDATLNVGKPNQLTFKGTAGAVNVNMPNMIVTSSGANPYGNVSTEYTGGLLTLFSGSTYNGNNGDYRLFTLYDLIPGVDYEITILGNMAATVRSSRFTVDGVGEQRVYAYAGGTTDGVFTTWQGTATSKDMQIMVEGADGNSWHITGILSRGIATVDPTAEKQLLMATGFGGLNYQYNSPGYLQPGAAISTTVMDTYNLFGADKKWNSRGWGSQAQVWAANATDNTSLAAQRGNNPMVVMWENCGITQDFDTSKFAFDVITLSADICPYGSNGIGMGFFDSQRSDAHAETSFTGLVMDQSGLYFMLDGVAASETFLYEAGFNKQIFHNLSMDLLLDPQGNATIVGLELEGGAANYADLLGISFEMSDMIGFMALARGGWGAVDNFTVFGSHSTPEPATWVMLLTAAGWLGFRGVRRKNLSEK